MISAMLGDIVIGDSVWTGPTALKDGAKASLVEHKVARGKPPVQDMGDELDTRSLAFFFDETICDPESELAKLRGAFEARQPLTYVAGDGSFNGLRYLVEDIDVETLKTTPYGRPVRFRVSCKLKEVPAASPLTFFAQIARQAASALAGLAAGNVGARR